MAYEPNEQDKWSIELLILPLESELSMNATNNSHSRFRISYSKKFAQLLNNPALK